MIPLTEMIHLFGLFLLTEVVLVCSIQTKFVIQRLLYKSFNFEGQSLLAVPGLGGEIDSTRSSLSEVSAISNASTKTYLDEASTLVLESTENGIKKYFVS